MWRYVNYVYYVVNKAMKFFYGKISPLHPFYNTHHLPPPLAGKNQHMLARTFLNRLIILAFLILVGWCLARGIYYRSVIGTILALTSLGAAIYCLYLVGKLKQEQQRQEETA